jgi:hypothetical protein
MLETFIINKEGRNFLGGVLQKHPPGGVFLVVRLAFPANIRDHTMFHDFLIKKYAYDPNHVVD